MDNNIYLYNNNFISLLNLIFTLIKNNVKPLNIKADSYQPTLLDNIVNLKIKDEEKIINNIIEKFGSVVFNIMYHVYLSEHENKELIIYYFFKNCFKYKNKIIYMRNLKCVNLALKISKYVGHENHKFKGLTRFKELNNHILYAIIEPENNILFLLSKHFKNRLKKEYWIIKDEKRKLYSIYDKHDFYLISEENFKLNKTGFTTNEEDIENLWKSFYKTISIKERENEKCRRNFMPKKYWKHIIEVSDEK